MLSIFQRPSPASPQEHSEASLCNPTFMITLLFRSLSTFSPNGVRIVWAAPTYWFHVLGLLGLYPPTLVCLYITKWGRCLVLGPLFHYFKRIKMWTHFPYRGHVLFCFKGGTRLKGTTLNLSCWDSAVPWSFVPCCGHDSVGIRVTLPRSRFI